MWKRYGAHYEGCVTGRLMWKRYGAPYEGQRYEKF